jgi:hypothetical protein
LHRCCCIFEGRNLLLFGRVSLGSLRFCGFFLQPHSI